MDLRLYLDSYLNPLSLLGLTTSLLCGTIVGTERQLSGKPAGVRTSILIILGTYIFVAVGIHMAGTSVDPSRVIGQVVTGIGFLGGGVILAREGVVLGVTSASVIWMLAGIGVLIGVGYNTSAVAMSLVTIFVLVGVNFLEDTFTAFQRGVYQKFHDITKKHEDRDHEERPRG